MSPKSPNPTTHRRITIGLNFILLSMFLSVIAVVTALFLTVKNSAEGLDRADIAIFAIFVWFAVFRWNPPIVRRIWRMWVKGESPQDVYAD